MTAGTYISGSAHLILILWVVLGGVLFRARAPEVFETADVSLLSAEEFAALQPRRAEPQAAQIVTEPEAPATEDTPDTPAATDAPDDPAPRPEIADPADPDAAPEAPDLSTPPAEADDVAPDTPIAPDTETLTALLPPTLDPGRPRDLPRVAPVAAPEAPPEADTAPEFVAPVEASAEPETEATPVDETTATAPEAATTEIVTEAEEDGASAPAAPVRPRRAPARPSVKPDPPSEDPVAAAVAEAVANAATEDQTPVRPVGPPLSFGEKEGLRVAVGGCWNVGTLSSRGLNVTVVVGVSMNRDGTPDAGSIRMLSFEGGNKDDADRAFEYARRAILICGRKGYDLPAGKYAHWREIEMTFNPERMRIK